MATDPTPAHWQRYLRSSGVVDFYALPLPVQHHLSAGFPAWMRRQATIGKVILAVILIVVLTAVMVIITAVI